MAIRPITNSLLILIVAFFYLLFVSFEDGLRDVLGVVVLESIEGGVSRVYGPDQLFFVGRSITQSVV